MAETFAWSTVEVKSRSRFPSVTGTTVDTTWAVIGATTAFRSSPVISTGPPSKFTLNTRLPAPPAPPPVAPCQISAKCNRTVYSPAGNATSYPNDAALRSVTYNGSIAVPPI